MNTNYLENNHLVLVGKVTSDKKFSHEIYGESFYIFDLEVARLSGNSDIIPITISERLILEKELEIGDKVARQVILDLKGKLNVINTGLFAREDHSKELTEALLGLGYKQADVKKIVSKVNSSLPVEEQIKEALKLLLK